jgi:hypothetical protein
LQAIVVNMEARHGMLGRVWITDRGMASAENLAWLRVTGRRYIIGGRDGHREWPRPSSKDRERLPGRPRQ